MPPYARAYWSLIVVLGSTACVYSARHTNLQTFNQWLELATFVVAAVFAGGKKITLVKPRDSQDSVSMSLGFAVTFATMLRFGLIGALAAGVTSCLSGCLYPKRQAPYQLLFNVALTAVEAFLGAATFELLNAGHHIVSPQHSLFAAAAAATAYFLGNTGGVAVMIALCSKQNLLRLWRETFLWTAPSYFAAASVSAFAMFLFGQRIGYAFLLVLPIAYFIYQSYSVYTARAEEKQKHIEELQHNQARLAELYLATIKSLALAIDAKDQYTHQHILRVQRYAVAIAVHMGLSGDELEAVNTGALLHDIGKLGVPEYVLLKPGRLTDDEFDKIKKHPEIGAAILDPVEFPWPVVPVVRHHHEKWDGTGYPDGLKGEEIPLSARIMAVADVYDALTSSRSYRSAWTHDKAMQTIIDGAGSHFDPVVVEAFVEAIGPVIEEMAESGSGPLTNRVAEPQVLTSKSAKAAQDISRVSTEFWALYEVAQTLSTSLGLNDTIEILSRKLEAIFPGVCCVFLVADESREKLFAKAAVGVNKEFFEGAATIGKHGRTWQVLESNKSHMGPYEADDLILSSAATEWTTLQSSIIVPITYEGQVLATLNLYHPSDAYFDHHDLQLLETISERTAMALYNGILFDRNQGHAFSDPLTGIYNLRYFTQKVDEKCQAATTLGYGEHSFAVLCLDLDSFKPINDNFGHQKGDEVLCSIAAMFVAMVGEKGVVARYGGDEFLMIINESDKATVEAMARDLQAAVDNLDVDLVHYRLGKLHLGVSVGTAFYPHDGEDCTSLLSAADSDMYRRKTERKLAGLATREQTWTEDPAA